MSIRHKDIIIDKANPFANCKLGRQKYAGILTQIIKSYDDGFVLAINNEWGTGKTTFVKMWQQQLENAEIKTLYFNAWENDFEINPIAAILAELKKLLTQESQISYHSLLKKGAVLAQSILPAVIKGVAKKYIDTEDINNAIEGAAKGGTEILKNEIDSYIKKQKGFKEFRNELEKFVKDNVTNKPLVFIIDELDRCRPDFAIEVLEKMKHFFSVSGIVFVLSIDKKQLENAVKGFYGSEQINASEYLRRFIDIEYTIPQPSTKAFCSYLYDYFSFDDFFQNPVRAPYRDWKDDKEIFIEFSTMLFENHKLSLREQEKMYAHARLALKTFEHSNFVLPATYIFLIYLKSYHKDLYFKITNRQLLPQQFVNEIEKILPDINLKKNPRYLGHVTSMLLFIYHNFYRELVYDSELIVEDKEKLTKEITIISKYDPNNKDSLIMNYIESFSRTDIYSLKITFLTDRIDLMENIKS